MSTLTFDSDDYITEADKREIARQAFHTVAAKKSAEDFERILSNAAYHLVRKEVDAAFNGNMVEVVRNKAVEVIKTMTVYTVFKGPDAWDRESSTGWKHLQQAMNDAQPFIAERVQQIVATLDEDQLRSEIGERIASAILTKLSGSAA